MSAPLITFLIGHRGVGKSSLLLRLQKFHLDKNIKAHFFDLDQFIVEQENKSIKDIFANEHEDAFRAYEKKYLAQILDKFSDKNVFVALGAGYEGELPKGARVVFVQRVTDKKGRIFFDRPRLNSSLGAYEESISLYKKRHSNYLQICTDQFFLPEGGYKKSPRSEKVFFGLIDSPKLGGVLTVSPDEIGSVAEKLKYGVDKLELRSDDWSAEQVQKLLNSHPKNKFLFSHRTPNRQAPVGVAQDWGLEMGEPPGDFFDIVSLHTRQKSLEETFFFLQKYEKKAQFLKLAIPIESFTELKKGHQWHLRNPKKHCFLPMSKTGKWAWYRLWQKNKIFPNFFKESYTGSAHDQPFFYQWCQYQYGNPSNFAAILGHPVDHSWTPNEQKDFFSKYNMPVLNIPIAENEFGVETLNLLQGLGLRAAAVTSPLKKKAKELVNNSQYTSINTLVYCDTSKKWQGVNTDNDGLVELFKTCRQQQSLALWGGGALVPSIKKLTSGLVCYSSRTGTPKDDNDLQVKNPQTLIWAVGRSREFRWPPIDWQPKQVIDLNYTENSPGREYALMVGADYVGGEVMFYKQAEKQREFWSRFLENSIGCY